MTGAKNVDRTRESVVERYLVREIQKLGGVCEKFTSPAKRGAPDRVAIIQGRVIFIEVKTQTGVVSKLQRLYHTNLTNAGAQVCTVYGKTGVDLFIKWLINELPPVSTAEPDVVALTFKGRVNG